MPLFPSHTLPGVSRLVQYEEEEKEGGLHRGGRAGARARGGCRAGHRLARGENGRFSGFFVLSAIATLLTLLHRARQDVGFGDKKKKKKKATPAPEADAAQPAVQGSWLDSDVRTREWALFAR